MKSSESDQKRKSGRPSSFNRDLALRQAMIAFWRSGYETTSVANLCDAMGITAPSLYTSFGDKQRLFLEAMALYTGDPADIEAAIDRAPTAQDAVRALLTGAAETYTGVDTPPGCLIASATASGSAGAADVQHHAAKFRRRVQNSIHRRIERDVAEGILPGGIDPAALAGLAMALTQGMSVLARDGATRASLKAIANCVISEWPKGVGSTPAS